MAVSCRCSILPKHGLDDDPIVHIVTVNEQVVFQLLAHAEESQFSNLHALLGDLLRV